MGIIVCWSLYSFVCLTLIKGRWRNSQLAFRNLHAFIRHVVMWMATCVGRDICFVLFAPGSRLLSLSLIQLSPLWASRCFRLVVLVFLLDCLGLCCDTSLSPHQQHGQQWRQFYCSRNAPQLTLIKKNIHFSHSLAAFMGVACLGI